MKQFFKKHIFDFGLIVLAISIVVLANFNAVKTTLAKYFQTKESDLSTFFISEINITKTGVEASLEAVREWYVRHQLPAGDFDYEYNVLTDTYSEDNNIVRQAGTLYDLILLYQYKPNQELKTALIKGVNYFVGCLYKETLPNGKTVQYIHFQGKTRANASAFFAMALIRILETDIVQEINNVPELIDNVGNYLVNSYLPGRGFDNNFLNNKGTIEESDYNNGESFLALVRLYRLTRHEKYLEIIKKVVPYFLEKYPKDIHLRFYSWGSQAFYELYTIIPQEEYVQIVFSMSDDAITHERYVDLKDYYFPVHYCVKGVLNEGLLPAILLAREKNDSTREKIYTENFMNMLKLILASQAMDKTGLSEEVFEKVKGGFYSSLKKESQRLDYNHHDLSVLIAYMRNFP